MIPLSSEQAETVALQALGWLVANEDLLTTFLGASGASSEDLRHGAADPAFQASVLDFLMMDDTWVTDCTAALSRTPDTLMRARAGLPGGGQVHWT